MVVAILCHSQRLGLQQKFNKNFCYFVPSKVQEFENFKNVQKVKSTLDCAKLVKFDVKSFNIFK